MLINIYFPVERFLNVQVAHIICLCSSKSSISIILIGATIILKKSVLSNISKSNEIVFLKLYVIKPMLRDSDDYVVSSLQCSIFLLPSSLKNPKH